MAETIYKGKLQNKINEEELVTLHPETAADQVIYDESTGTTVKDKLDNILGNNGSVANADVANKVKISTPEQDKEYYIPGFDIDETNGDMSKSLKMSGASVIYNTSINKTLISADDFKLAGNLISEWYPRLNSANGTIPSSYLPGYVDDVVEYKYMGQYVQEGNTYAGMSPVDVEVDGATVTGYIFDIQLSDFPTGYDTINVTVQNPDNVLVIENPMYNSKTGYVRIYGYAVSASARVDFTIELGKTGDDVFPNPGESGKIYVETTTNKSYRWSGSQYVEISSSLALGETKSTAYAGDKGKANADAIAALQTSLGDYALKANFKYLGETNVDPAQVSSHPLLNAMFPSDGSDDPNLQDITPTIYVFRYKNGYYYETYMMTCAWKSAAQYHQTIYGPNGRLIVRQSNTDGANGTGGGSWHLVKDGTIALTSNVPSVSNYIEVGEEGQTAPSDSLAIGGLFFKRTT